MTIRVITPSPPEVVNGNRITARRWARMLRSQGHRVTVHNHYRGESCRLLIALHAFKSYDSIRLFRQRYPQRPLIVALTGTDIYRDIGRQAKARRSLHWATRLVVLQNHALEVLPQVFRGRARVVYQSAEPPLRQYELPKHFFRVCVVGNLRPEKDPFRVARASRRLPRQSRIKVVHVGKALSRGMEEKAILEGKSNPRYRWVGPLTHGRTRALLASSHLLAITSRIEGSSNVLSEALVSSVPVVASRIPALMGTLGDQYSAYFAVGDTIALAGLLTRAESDQRFYRALRRQCRTAARLAAPQREHRLWKGLIREVSDLHEA